MTAPRQGRWLRTGRLSRVGLGLAAGVLPAAPSGAISLKALVGPAASIHHVAAFLLIAVIGAIGLFFGLLL